MDVFFHLNQTKSQCYAFILYFLLFIIIIYLFIIKKMLFLDYGHF